MIDKDYLKRELFELSHEIFKIQADVYDSSYEDTRQGLSICLNKLIGLVGAYQRFDKDNSLSAMVKKIQNTKGKEK